MNNEYSEQGLAKSTHQEVGLDLRAIVQFLRLRRRTLLAFVVGFACLGAFLAFSVRSKATHEYVYSMPIFQPLTELGADPKHLLNRFNNAMANPEMAKYFAVRFFEHLSELSANLNSNLRRELADYLLDSLAFGSSNLNDNREIDVLANYLSRQAGVVFASDTYLVRLLAPAGFGLNISTQNGYTWNLLIRVPNPEWSGPVSAASARALYDFVEKYNLTQERLRERQLARIALDLKMLVAGMRPGADLKPQKAVLDFLEIYRSLGVIRSLLRVSPDALRADQQLTFGIQGQIDLSSGQFAHFHRELNGLLAVAAAKHTAGSIDQKLYEKIIAEATNALNVLSDMQNVERIDSMILSTLIAEGIRTSQDMSTILSGKSAYLPQIGKGGENTDPEAVLSLEVSNFRSSNGALIIIISAVVGFFIGTAFELMRGWRPNKWFN